MQEKKCFISILKKLKMSSKEAIEGNGDISEFNEYMHVERPIDTEFNNLIEKVQDSEGAKLILVCGSVGGGKSHLISYFKKHSPNIMDKFEIYNDATESLSPKKDSVQTLSEQLIDFSDEKIDTSNRKLILAINLGTLTNFIDSEYGEKFSKLKEYVHEKRILDEVIVENEFDANNNFHYVNFMDYDMYELTSEGIKSEYMSQLLKKVTSTSEDNIIYGEYKEKCCGGCSCVGACPIKENYENLMSQQVQESIVQKLIEIIVKSKVIISTRSLINFIYDILVSPNLDSTPEEELLKKISDLKIEDYIKSLTASMIFENKETSNIIRAISELDPLSVHNEEVDELIVNLNNTEKFQTYFDEYLCNNVDHYYYKYVTLEPKKIKNSVRISIMKLFIRLLSLTANDKHHEIFKDDTYREYMKYLYHSNRNDREEMKKILTFVKESIYRWNGTKLEENQIHLLLGNKQSKYILYEGLEVIGDLKRDDSEKGDKLEKFNKTILVSYKVKGRDSKFNISIDYSLYELLKKVEKGYRLNRRDKNNFINFMEFVENLQKSGSHNEKIYFDGKFGNQNISYELKLDEYGDYCLVEREI